MRDRVRMRRASRAVRVGPSEHGQGVFAKRSFAPDECIGEITGEVIDDPYYSSDYCMNLGETFTLEPAAPFRFVNHSCEPNCQLCSKSEWNDETEVIDHEMWLLCIAPIARGEQLTIDYGWPAWCQVPCNCGTASCRGFIVRKDAATNFTKTPAS